MKEPTVLTQQLLPGSRVHSANVSRPITSAKSRGTLSSAKSRNAIESLGSNTHRSNKSDLSEKVDPAVLSVLKADVLDLQKRIDILSIGAPITAVTHPMQVQEKALMQIEAESGDAKTKLYEMLLSKMGELSTYLVRILNSSGVLPPASSSPPRPNSARFGLSPFDISPKSGRVVPSFGALSFADDAPNGKVVHNPTPPMPLPTPYGNNVALGRASFIDVFFTLSDSLASYGIDDWETALQGAQNLQDDMERALSHLKANHNEKLEQVEASHAKVVEDVNAKWTIQLDGLQSQIAQLQEQIMVLTKGKGVPLPSSAAADKQLRDQMDALESELAQEREKLHKLEATLKESKVLAFNAVDMTEKFASRGVSITTVVSPLSPMTPISPLGAGFDGRKMSKASMARTPLARPESSRSLTKKVGTPMKGAKGAAQDAALEMEALDLKIQTLEYCLSTQNTLLIEIQDTVPAKLAANEEEIAELKAKCETLNHNFTSIRQEQYLEVAKLKKLLHDKQAEAILLRAEKHETEKHHKQFLDEEENDRKMKSSLPLVANRLNPPPVFLAQKVKGQHRTLAQLEKQVEALTDKASGHEAQRNEIYKQVDKLQTEKEHLQTWNRSLQLQVTQLEAAVEDKDTEVKNCEDQIHLLSQRIMRQSEGSSGVFERAKRREVKLAKAVEDVQAASKTNASLQEKMNSTVAEHDQAMENIMASHATEKRKLLEQAQQAESEASFAAGRIQKLKEANMELKQGLSKTLDEGLEMFDIAVKLMRRYFDLLTPQNHEQLVQMKESVRALKTALAQKVGQVHTSWRAYVESLENEGRGLMNLVDERMHDLED